MSIKAIVFDYGKVISFPPKESVMETLAGMAGLETSVFNALMPKYRCEYDRGVVSATEFYRAMLAAGGVSVDDDCLERMTQIDAESWSHVNPETVALMEEVKREGYILGILSNMPHDFLAFARASFPVFNMPDFSVFSCETGYIKPEKEIYNILLERLSCKAEEVIFFDDIQINVDKAVEVGIKAFLWQDTSQARIIIRSFM